MSRRVRNWVLFAVGALVVAACAMERWRNSDGGYARIRGTDVLVPRAWEAPVTPRDWNWIVIHHSASESGGAEAFDRYHRKRGWDELGYHFVIDNGEGMPDGQVEIGPRWLKQKQGAHAKSPSGEYNDRGIGICLVGNFEKGSPTKAQWQSLVKLVTYLSVEYGVTPDRIIGHRDMNDEGTLCPGRNLDLERLRRDIAR